MDDLIIHKIAKANIDAKERIENILYSLHMLEKDGQEKVTILSVEIAFENLKKILEVQNEGKTEQK